MCLDVFLKLLLRSAGKDLQNEQRVAVDGDTDPSQKVKFQFPSSFCLGPLENGTCNTPAGISAVVYDINPQVRIYIYRLIYLYTHESMER